MRMALQRGGVSVVVVPGEIFLAEATDAQAVPVRAVSPVMRPGDQSLADAAARHELSLPPKLTYGQIKGFTLYATRTMLSGAERNSSS
jgi:thiamine pyrophosphate-dependent acetolactate synthase large subunit-like protein